MASTKTKVSNIKVSNIVLVSEGKIPGAVEVKCPCCGFVNSFKVKSYLGGNVGHETQSRCSSCDAQIAFRWEKA